MEYAEMYLDLSSGGIEGGAEAAGYRNQIELNDWAWGIALEEASSTGTGAGSPGQAVGKGVTIRKPVDPATTAMLRKLEDGVRIPTATMVLVDRGEVGLSLTFGFKNVLLMDYDLEVESSDETVDLFEVWKFNYEEVSIQYRGRAKSGGARSSGGAQKFVLVNEWDSHMDAVELDSTPPLSSKAGALSGMNEKDLAKLVQKLVDEQLGKRK
jgi:type VI protein secretion system component Hcp